jgi:hypothetical protein
MTPLAAATFLALGSMLLWSIIVGRGRWLPKLAAVVAVGAFSWLLWGSASSFTGWPTASGPPKAALFLSGVVIEPDGDREGAVYVWLIPPREENGVYEYKPKGGEPRAYRLPYSRDLHQVVQNANQAVSEGKSPVFTTGAPAPAGGSGQGQPGDNGRGGSRPNGNTGGGDTGTAGGAYGMYLLPPAQGVQKDE